MADVSLSQFTLCGYIIVEEQDHSLSNIFEYIRDLPNPESLPNQFVNINDESPEESIIILTGSAPEEETRFDEHDNRISVDVDEDGDVHIHAEGDSSQISEYQSIFMDILNEYDELVMAHLDFGMKIDASFDELDLPVIRDSEYRIDGVQLTEGSESFIISRHNTDEDATSVAHTLQGNTNMTSDNPNFVEDKLEMVKQFASDLAQ